MPGQSFMITADPQLEDVQRTLEQGLALRRWAGLEYSASRSYMVAVRTSIIVCLGSVARAEIWRSGTVRAPTSLYPEQPQRGSIPGQRLPSKASGAEGLFAFRPC
jgi:hypothetical protein